MVIRRSDVPSTKLLQCKRHATRLGLYESVITVESVEVNNETDKESLGSENGNDVNYNICNETAIIYPTNGKFFNNGSSSSSSSSSSASKNIKRKNLFSEPERTCKIATRYRGSRTTDIAQVKNEVVVYDWDDKICNGNSEIVTSLNIDKGKFKKTIDNSYIMHDVIVIDDGSDDDDEGDSKIYNNVSRTADNAPLNLRTLELRNSSALSDNNDTGDKTGLSFFLSTKTVGAGHCVPVGEGNYGDTGHLGNSESPINPVAGIFSPKLVRPKINRFS